MNAAPIHLCGSLALALLPSLSLAAPQIMGVSASGTLSNGEVITISGSGFGEKGRAAPLASSYDNATAANNWSTGVVPAGVTPATLYLGGNPADFQVSSTEHLRSGFPESSYNVSYDPYSDNITHYYHTVSFDHPSPAPAIYTSFWMYRDYDRWGEITGAGNNTKFWRVYNGDPPNSDQCVTVNVADAPGSSDTLYSLNYPSEPSHNLPYEQVFLWSLEYSAPGCQSGQYAYQDYQVVLPATSPCVPSLQKWEHWEVFQRYPSAAGVRDGIAILWKDGQTLGRSSQIDDLWMAGQNNQYRLFRIGQVSGGRYFQGDHAYLDEVYIDDTLAHVLVSDNPSLTTWLDTATASHNEVQVASAWSDGQITFTLNQGSFSEGPVYLYVLAADGQVSNGYSITLGAAAPPPNNTPADTGAHHASGGGCGLGTHGVAQPVALLLVGGAAALGASRRRRAQRAGAGGGTR